jgi:hypothetical protein
MQKIAGIITESQLNESRFVDQDFKDLKVQQDILKKVSTFYREKAEKLGVDRNLVGDFFQAMDALETAIFKADYNKVDENLTNEAEEESIPTINSSDILKIQQSPEVKKLAAAISKDPKSIDKLNQIMKKAGVTLQEVEGVNIDAEDIKNIAAVIAPSLNEYEERAGAGDIVSAGFWLGAGATLIPGALEAVNNVLTLAPYNPAGGIAAMVAGALLGAVYALITGAE